MNQACRSLLRALPKRSCPLSSPSSSLGSRRLSKVIELPSSSSPTLLKKLSSCPGWSPVSYSQRQFCQAQALRFSSVASPILDKDGSSDSFVEENNGSGDDKVEPVSAESKDEPAIHTKEDHAAKIEQEEKEALLSSISQLDRSIAEKDSQLTELTERTLTTKAELDSVRGRTQREAESTKKFAVQDFAKSLLDVADNLGRALATVPANVRQDLLKDETETGKLLKSLVEGVMLTEKELMKVLKKFGVEKFEPVGQQFDPNSHLALFEIADPSKDSGTVAIVAKVGYMLHDRVLRPAEVGVVKSLE